MPHRKKVVRKVAWIVTRYYVCTVGRYKGSNAEAIRRTNIATMATNTNSNAPTTLHERVQAINRWCMERGIEQKYSFFRGCDPSIEQHYLRIRQVFSMGRSVMCNDEAWIESMEATMDALNNRQAA